MRDDERKRLNEKKLAELEPDFKIKVDFLLSCLESRGWHVYIASAFRSLPEQQKKVADGKSRTMKSKHVLTTADGRPAAQAVDIVDSRWAWNMPKDALELFIDFLADMDSATTDLGLTWGGRGEWWLEHYPPHGDWAHVEAENLP